VVNFDATEPMGNKMLTVVSQPVMCVIFWHRFSCINFGDVCCAGWLPTGCNADKTELLWAGSRFIDEVQLFSKGSSVQINSETVFPSDVVSGVNLVENWGGRGDDTACGPKFESLIHIIGHDKTSDTVEDNLY